MNELGVAFDVLIVDEGAHASKAENCIAFSLMARKAQQKGMPGLHIILFGDHLQLPPVHKSGHPVHRFLNVEKDVYYRTPWWGQLMSLFKRVVQDLTCPVSWLCSQYRMHPDLGCIQFRQVYNRLPVTHPTDCSPYLAPYHDGTDLAPLTFVDTQALRSIMERSYGKGDFTNPTEANEVNMILQQFMDRAPKATNVDPIFVTAPYRSQVAFLKSFLENPGSVLANRWSRGRLEVRIETIDSLQGLERPIVVISMTRSNRYGKIGFMKDERRINVATSRAQKLLVVVGDSSTLCDRSAITRNFWRACLHKRCGTKIVHRAAFNGTGVDRERQKIVNDLKKNVRGPDGYNFRPRGERDPGSNPGI